MQKKQKDLIDEMKMTNFVDLYLKSVLKKKQTNSYDCSMIMNWKRRRKKKKSNEREKLQRMNQKSSNHRQEKILLERKNGPQTKRRLPQKKRHW